MFCIVFPVRKIELDAKASLSKEAPVASEKKFGSIKDPLSDPIPIMLSSKIGVISGLLQPVVFVGPLISLSNNVYSAEKNTNIFRNVQTMLIF